jgi:hypothetical protein
MVWSGTWRSFGEEWWVYRRKKVRWSQIWNVVYLFLPFYYILIVRHMICSKLKMRNNHTHLYNAWMPFFDWYSLRVSSSVSHLHIT